MICDTEPAPQIDVKVLGEYMLSWEGIVEKDW